MFEKFLSEIKILDTETTGIDPKTSSFNPKMVDVVEFATCQMVDNNWLVRSELFNSTYPLPFEASAVNNISRSMIDGLDVFSDRADDIMDWLDLDNTKYLIAHNTQYDNEVLKSNLGRGGIIHDIFDEDYKKRWICTYRLARRLLTDEEVKYNQQYLRYYFDIDNEIGDITEGNDPHRAGSDTYICAHLLMKLIDVAIEDELVDPEQDIGEQLVKLCWEPMPITKWPYGKKYKGKKFEDIPTDFYEWALSNMNELEEDHIYYNEDLADIVAKVLTERLGLD